MKTNLLKSIFISLILLVGTTSAWAANITGGTTLYLKPNSNWTKDGARFAAYLCNGSSSAKWYSMSDCNGDGIYEMTVNSSESHKNVIFCRMNGSNSTNNWDNKWNQTSDLTWDGTKNQYTVKDGTWDYGGGTWSAATYSDKVVYLKPNGNWKTDNAQFMAYAFDNCSNNEWISMTEIGCAGDYYTCTIPAKYNKVIFARMNPKRSNNNFDNNVCWNKTNDLTTPTGDKVLFTITDWTEGSWETYSAPQYAITITNGTGGTVTVKQGANTITSGNAVNLNAVITATLAANDGYSKGTAKIKIGDNAEADLVEGQEYTICGPTTITGNWTAKTYTVTLDLQSGTDGTTSVTATYGSAMPSITKPTRTGYTFNGYYDATSGGTQYYKADGSSARTWNKTSNSTLYAQWTAKQYSITYKDQGNTTFSGTHASDYPTTHTYGTATTLKTASKTGYTFEGWHTDAACTQKVTSLGATAYTGNITLYAKWTANTYNITYIEPTNGIYTIKVGNNTAVSANTTAAYNTNITLANTPATGYHFGSWTITPSVSITNNTTFSMPANDVTVAINFVANTYSVIFNGNGNTGGSMNNQSFTYNVSQKLRTNSFTKTGYAFEGWATTANGEVTYTDAQSVKNLTTTNNGTVTLYAKWGAKPTTIYLKPGLPWKKDNARFAIYAWGGTDGDKWVDMTPVGCDDEYYTADVPAGYTNFKFVRLNPTTTENNFNDGTRWGETGNLSIPDDGKNLYDMSKKLHLNRGTWNQDSSGRYAVYFFKEGDDDFGNAWVDLIAGNETDVYYCDVPSNKEYPNVIFCRMNPSQGNGWDNNQVWHQTGNLSLEDGNYYTITSFGGNGNNAGGNWSYIYTGEWSTLDLPTITITNNNPDYGTITVTTADGTEITSGTQVDWDTEVIVSILPNSGYSVQSSSIQIGNKAATTIQQNKRYTICNNTNISVSFEEKSEYYIIGIDGVWDTFQEKYKFVDGKLLLSLEADGNKTFKIAKVKGGNVQDRYGKANTYTFKGNINTGQLESANAEGGGDHCILEPVHNGDFLFVWDENTTTLTIEYPDVCFLHGDFNGWKDKAQHALHDRDAIVYLTAGSDYEFKVAEKGIYYTAEDYTTKMTQTGDSKTMDDDKNYNTAPYHNCIVNATVTGRYIFHFDSETRILTITYPKDMTPATGDYRLIYRETGKKDHPSNIVKKRTDNGQDTVSLYIHKDGTSPQVLLQQLNGSTWTTTATYNVADMNAIQNDTHEDQGNGVWNFIIQQNNNIASVLIDVSHPERYTGNYYIRTDCADGGWDEYPIPENKMTFASYSKEHCNFSHYFCKWVQDAGVNVKYTIANDYSEAITDSLTADVKTLEGTELADNEKMVTGETVPAMANIRFSWNEATNVLHRAYISGATYVSERFLVLEGDEKLKNDEGYTFTDDNQIEGLNEHETSFADLQNWIYQVDVYASKYTKVKLSAKYNNKVQYFVGAQEAVNLINSSSEKDYKIRIIYDFKTNHLIAAWLAGGNTVDEEGGETLGADLMIIRRNQSAIEQLTFTPNNNPLRTVETAYAVTTFDKTFITNSSLTPYERSLYWISFPFDVKISDVFGFGEYGEHWIMEYYDGAARAKNGLWADTDTYWKYITNKEYTLKAGTGYVLALNLSKVISSFIHDVADVSLYFPSKDYLGDIDGTLPESVTIPAHTCTITRDNRNIYDSHWNLIGVPGFADITGVNTTPNEWLADSLSFYFEYLPQTDEYRTQTTYMNNNTFRTMFSYMVQYTGTINWTTPASLSAIAARRIGTMPDKYSLRLEMAQNDELVDQTYIELHENKATADFDMNIDLTKILNNSANIYTLTANTAIMVAGNALPMEKATVPVGVRVATAGEYTFRMPDGTDGIAVTLVDNATGTHTNMLMSEYTVTLNAGTIENRFYLVVDPDRTATSVENIGEEAKGVEKFLIDGKLFIRTADGIFDAKGQRL